LCDGQKQFILYNNNSNNNNNYRRIVISKRDIKEVDKNKRRFVKLFYDSLTLINRKPKTGLQKERHLNALQ